MDIIPLNIPEKRILKIISKTLEEFKEHDDRVVQEDILFIQASKIKNCQRIKLPDDVRSVTRLETTSSGGMSSFSSDERKAMSNGGGSSDVLSYVSAGAYNQLLKSMSVRFVPYDFSRYTSILTLEGTPDSGIFLEVSRFIPEEDMFKISDIESYAAAKIQRDIMKVGGFIGIKLMEGREINFDNLAKDSERTIEKIEKGWEDQMGNAVLLLD